MARLLDISFNFLSNVGIGIQLHIQAIHKFDIKCKRHKPVNFTDPDNWQQLHFHAHRLKTVSYRSHRKNINIRKSEPGSCKS
jgi:hypothetical protein